MSPRIAIYGKKSKAQIDMEQWKLHDHELEDVYRREGIPQEKIDRILDSHRVQARSLKLLRELLPDAFLVQWSPTMLEPDNFEEWSDALGVAREAEILISLGGDNNFQYASGYREDGLLLGLNSDPGPNGSHGKLLWGTVENFAPYAERLLKGDYIVQPWVRLDLDLNGRFAGRASNQISLGASHPRFMSRHVLETPDGRRVEQTGSGLLVATGAGSTGWYRSERGTTRFDFPRDAQEAHWFIRAAQREDDDSVCELAEGVLYPGEKLIVRSLNARGGYASTDDECFPDDVQLAQDRDVLNFNRGAVATIRISEHPLRVIMF